MEEAGQGMEDEYLEAFQMFDADGSGDVSPEELKQVDWGILLLLGGGAATLYRSGLSPTTLLAGSRGT